MLSAEEARIKREQAILDIDKTVRQQYLPIFEKGIEKAIELGHLKATISFMDGGDLQHLYPEKFTVKSIVSQLEQEGYIVDIEELNGHWIYERAILFHVSWGDDDTSRTNEDSSEKPEEDFFQSKSHVRKDAADVARKEVKEKLYILNSEDKNISERWFK